MEGKDEPVLTKTVGGYPTKKKNAACVYEGKLVPLKGKVVEFWLKLLGVGTPQKRLEYDANQNLCLRQGNFALQAQMKGF